VKSGIVSIYQDGSAIVQVRGKSDDRLMRLGAAAHVSGALHNSDIPQSGDGVARQRRPVAAFCRMLGEQLMDERPALVSGQALSRRQRQTLELLLTGNAEKQIANHLSISRHTVHVYVKSLYKRFGVCSRGELLARWVQK
jgi:DNA-binding NarL/FixJ family response regulator